jgi:uncharacterized membrane protein
MAPPPPPSTTSLPTRWLAVLGFALGGFFDGILLHQLLQWHHLLSLVPGVVSLQAQILWDGYFHALMYVLATVALWRIWRARAGLQPRAGPPLPAVLLGFGLWHLVDTLLSHWLLGIHRVRLDSAQPLAWDVAWLVMFGLVPIAISWWWRRKALVRAGTSRMGSAPLAMLALVTVSAGLWAMLPPDGADQSTTVVFAPGMSAAQAIAAIRAVDARIAWSSPDMAVVLLNMAPERRAGLYLQGAVLVGGSGLPAGCAGWSRV